MSANQFRLPFLTAGAKVFGAIFRSTNLFQRFQLQRSYVMSAKLILIVTAVLLAGTSSARGQTYSAYGYGHPYYGYSYYGYPYYRGLYAGTAYGSYLHGWADLERAYGERELSHWQAQVFAEEARQREIYNWELYRQVRVQDLLRRQERSNERIHEHAVSQIGQLKAQHTANFLAAQDLVEQVKANAHQWPAALERNELRPLISQVESLLTRWPVNGAATWNERQALRALSLSLREALSSKNPFGLSHDERALGMEIVSQLEALAIGDSDPRIVDAAAKAGLPTTG
jgi:hypothetical protein